MLFRNGRFRAIVAVAGLAASMFATQLSFSPAAQARCAGAANEVVSKLIVANVTYVTETPTAGTCNGSDYYSSDFRSLVAGWRASIRIQNNGLWTTHYGAYNTIPVHMSYEDDNSNSLIVLCADDGRGTWMCGYHDEVTISNAPTANFWRNNYGF
jgi:hypothetical protein